MDFLFQLNLGHLIDSKSGLIHFWASNLLDALFIPYEEKGEREMDKRDDMRTGWFCDCGEMMVRDPENEQDYCPNCGYIEEWPKKE